MVLSTKCIAQGWFYGSLLKSRKREPADVGGLIEALCLADIISLRE